MSPRRRNSPALQRIRSLIALDASNVMARLTRRREEMVSLFSRLRDRGPLLAALECWFSTVTFAELSALEPEEQGAVSQFYELLSELRWYARYTEDMPLQVQQKVDRLATELGERHRLVLAVLGAPGGKGSVVVVGPVRESQPPAKGRQARSRPAKLRGS
jgi:hypothetical protein